MENTQSSAVAVLPRTFKNRSALPLPAQRVWTVKDVAARLNRSPSWVYQNNARLRQLGFPPKDAFLGGWDSHAVEAWLDSRSGVASTADIENQMLEAIRGDC